MTIKQFPNLSGVDPSVTSQPPKDEDVCDVLFTYGALRKGASHEHLMHRCEWLGVVETQPSFTLYKVGWYPAMVATGAHIIQGDLYQVEPTRWAKLDAFEDAPGLYERTPILVSGRWVWAYVLPVHRLTWFEDAEPLDAGNWLQAA